MKSILALAFLVFFGIALAGPKAVANPKPNSPAWVAGLKEPDFSRLLAQVKALQKKGARTYLQAEAQSFAESLRPMAPKLIVVRRDSVEFFLNSDLHDPQILRFWRAVGVWSPNALLWVADYRAPAQSYESRLWETKERMSETDLKVERQISALEETLKGDRE